MTKPILILDDDNAFRQLIAGMFQTRGYQVFEARSAKEASAAFSEVDPGLAIVDYRLPESDGITWISWLRESGRNFPVVFCSGTWCDEKTFTWLRNILRVSLILRKPIVPELFMQQIENLLPPAPVSAPKDNMPDLTLPAKGYISPVTADDLKLQIFKLDDAIGKSNPETATYNQLVAMRSKLVVQQMLAEAKQAYAIDLPSQWTALSEAVSLTQKEPDNKIALDEGIQLSHRLRGTAGAMGFHEVGLAAGKIEDLLRRFDPTDTLSEVLWTEIFRTLVTGEISVRGLAVEAGIAAPPQEKFDASVLLFGLKENYAECVKLLSEQKIEGVIFDNITSAVNATKTRKFDAAVFDLGQGDDQEVFDLAGTIRESQPGAPIGLSFISAGQNAPNEAAIAYAGSSAFFWSPAPAMDLVENIQRNLTVGGSNKLKVLTVDDDDALTRFIQTILGAEGLIVEALNKPIQILSTVEQFQPDLILLDVMMPGLSGYDVCRLIRATEKWSELPILFLTSKSDGEGRAAAFHAGATDFLSKPILAPELVSRVHAHLGKGNGKRTKNGARAEGLVNRKDFIEGARAMVAGAHSTSADVSLSLILIDDLLNLSITHGVSGAEAVEDTLAELLRIHFKAESLRARWGEGGFALAVPGENKNVITEAIEKLLADFKLITFVSEDQVEFKATFSAGVSGVPGDDVTIENLMNLANVRMSRGRQLRAGTIVSSGS